MEVSPANQGSPRGYQGIAGTQIAAPDADAMDAFEGLREEMSLMVAAVKDLTAAKDKIPDYEPTLREIIRFLGDIDKRLGSVEAKPAMILTPAVMANEFGKRAVEVRAEDRQAINSAREAFARSLGHVEGLIKRSCSTEEQQWWVTWGDNRRRACSNLCNIDCG